MILQLPLRSSTRSFAFINTSLPDKRTFLLKPYEVLCDMPENSTDIQSDNALKRYERRPRVLRNCCLEDFVCQYNVVFPKKCKQQNSEQEFLPENEQNESDDEVMTSNDTSEEMSISDEEIPMADGTILKKRNQPKVLRYVRYNKDQDPENYFREQLMLFYPWRKEKEDLLGAFDNYENHYNEKIDVINVNRMKYEMDNGVTEILENNLKEVNGDNYVVAAEVQHNEEIDSNEQSSNQSTGVFHGFFNPKDMGYDYDLGLDIGITRKQISDCEYQVNSLDQNAFMSLV